VITKTTPLCNSARQQGTDSTPAHSRTPNLNVGVVRDFTDGRAQQRHVSTQRQLTTRARTCVSMYISFSCWTSEFKNHRVGAHHIDSWRRPAGLQREAGTKAAKMAAFPGKQLTRSTVNAYAKNSKRSLGWQAKGEITSLESSDTIYGAYEGKKFLFDNR
jgi:hypothetical protein